MGRGTFVNKSDPRSLDTCSYAYKHFPLRPADDEFAQAARKLRIEADQSLDALQILTRKPGLIHFTASIPDPSLVRPGILEKCTSLALKRGQCLYQEYTEACGLRELRKTIALRYREKGLYISENNVLITSGSQQALAILAQVALEKQYRVIVESPCYMGLTKTFSAIGHWVESLARDETGPVTEEFNRFADKQPSLLYLCTKLHNPLGTDLTPAKAKMIKNWARQQDSLVVSDEIFEDLYFTETMVPSYLEQLGQRNTVVVSSLSKSFMCGLRIGWIIADEERIRSIWPLKRAIDIGSPALMQGIALALLESGEYDRHIKKGREHYRIHKDCVLEGLEKNMPDGVHWTNPAGGIHMWLELPPGYSSVALFLLAIKKGVAITPGPKMDIDHRFLNGFKLSYGSISIDQIVKGVKLLAEAVKELLRKPPFEPGLSSPGDFH